MLWNDPSLVDVHKIGCIMLCLEYGSLEILVYFRSILIAEARATNRMSLGRGYG